MQDFFRRILGKRVEPQGPEVDELFDLWSQAHALTSDPKVAWTAAVGLLLRDPDLVMY
jgi:hypothetical protein